ncbi:MAG: nicotinate-nucleotide--dimethylbenzimidazole phosphoribosyltransferase, partial [Lachnospiraceae bacterium]|nr:nicotinate-nucleotide--dimethylbenzimidazole phosphoribosyltransferase [Lachnospiraceae bacterium]
MECSRKQTLTEYSLNSLRAIHVSSPDEEYKNRVKKHWDDVAKPLDGMGDFEDILCKIGAIQKSENIKLDKKALLIMCADNGIVKEGVSQSDSSVTLSVAKNMAKGRSSVAVMAEKNGIDVFVYDVGIDTDEEAEGVINRKLRKGTNDFYLEPAMSEEETLKAINLGINLVKECVDKNYDIILTGEMGIGNTTTSAAVCTAIISAQYASEKHTDFDTDNSTEKQTDLDCDCDTDTLIEKLTGRGAGLDDEKFLNKKRIIRESIEKYSLKSADAFTVLKTVGGLDIAALTGICIGCAIYGIPVVLDGVITMTAGLVAEKICPGVKE